MLIFDSIENIPAYTQLSHLELIIHSSPIAQPVRGQQTVLIQIKAPSNPHGQFDYFVLFIGINTYIYNVKVCELLINLYNILKEMHGTGYTSVCGLCHIMVYMVNISGKGFLNKSCIRAQNFIKMHI